MTTVTKTTPGTYSGSSTGWLCPAGVTTALVECWGGMDSIDAYCSNITQSGNT
jgi:hypothetical protein